MEPRAGAEGTGARSGKGGGVRFSPLSPGREGMHRLRCPRPKGYTYSVPSLRKCGARPQPNGPERRGGERRFQQQAPPGRTRAGRMRALGASSASQRALYVAQREAGGRALGARAGALSLEALWVTEPLKVHGSLVEDSSIFLCKVGISDPICEGSGRRMRIEITRNRVHLPLYRSKIECQHLPKSERETFQNLQDLKKKRGQNLCSRSFLHYLEAARLLELLNAEACF